MSLTGWGSDDEGLMTRAGMRIALHSLGTLRLVERLPPTPQEAGGLVPIQQTVEERVHARLLGVFFG